MDPNQPSQPVPQQPAAQPVSPPPVVPAPAVVSSVVPWSLVSMCVIAVLFGFGAGYLTVWQNMKRIGRSQQEREKFLLIGGIGAIIFSAFAVLVPVGGLYIFGIIYPFWFEGKYMKPWKLQNPTIKPGMSKGIWGWGLLGLVLSFLIPFIFSMIFAKFGLVSLE